ncbi:type I-U CRISPR-associated RAMP protein Csb1/Cas7u [Planctellipticum variicoloris]|uniref:type I-G CRISPR-associated RAMP protein Csb1/Cas7g n=1 Tax=Planctellipticum variicoloris TaxID=3064265 RepID=UPI003013519C|nr:type I-U CRISPR-associated RAMP protein Csb1/Cas7u [Planctomycetaceae bacterium SH412]
MSELLDSYDHLLKDTGPAAIVLKQWLKPVGDPIVFPPTYANPKEKDPPVYNIDHFGDTTSLGKRFERFKKTHTFMTSERVEEGKLHSVCVIDSIPSQANRIEPAFARLVDDEGNQVKLVPTVKVKAKIDDEVRELDLLIDAGHRIADAMLRYTSIAADVSAAILARKKRDKPDSKPLAKLAPTSLIFGMWDSQATGVKIPRLINSIIRAYDVREYRRSSQFNPAMDFEAAGVTTDKGDVRLSEVGMDGAPSTFQLGGVEAIGGICREASLNLCTLRDIQSTSDEETLKLQRYILGLSLVAITYLDGKVLNLRQGCQLVGVPEKPMERNAINADGTEAAFVIDATAALKYASMAAADFGIGPDRIDIVFDAKAAKAARKKVKPAKEEDNA